MANSRQMQDNIILFKRNNTVDIAKRNNITAVVSTQRQVAGQSTVTVAEYIVTGRADGPFNSQIREGRLS